jgi:hypothetical protein
MSDFLGMRPIESFRDEEMTKLTFQGMATVRNSVPFTNIIHQQCYVVSPIKGSIVALPS